jgi:hypothetical protein
LSSFHPVQHVRKLDTDRALHFLHPCFHYSRSTRPLLFSRRLSTVCRLGSAGRFCNSHICFCPQTALW